MIQSYRNGIFRISGVEFSGPVIVFPDRSEAWAPADPLFKVSGLVIDDFSAIIRMNPAVTMIVLGCGPVMALPPVALRKSLKEQGIVIEPMETGAACRTYNVLAGEDRRVAAALLPIP